MSTSLKFVFNTDGTNSSQSRPLTRSSSTAGGVGKAPGLSVLLNKRQYSAQTSRLHRILIYNQESLNDLISSLNDANGCRSNSRSLSSEPLTQNLKKFNPSESSLIKKPFKHFVATNSFISTSSGQDSNRSQSSNVNKQRINPSSELLLRTAQNVNNFVDYFEKVQAQPQVNFEKKKSIRYTKYSGLKPLNLTIQSGPCIENCLGIIKEPKGKSSSRLKEVYEYKIKLLEQKYKMERLQPALSSNPNLSSVDPSTYDENSREFEN